MNEDFDHEGLNAGGGEGRLGFPLRYGSRGFFILNK